MAAYDRLPPEIRAALQQALVKWDARWVRWMFNKLLKAEPPTAAMIRIMTALIECDEEDIRLFRYHWPKRFGEYPHVAARATILRSPRTGDTRHG